MAEFMKGIVVMSHNEVKLVDDIPMQTYGDYEVLLKTRVQGFCNGTDMHIITGSLYEKGNEPYPAILGHESISEIVEKGSKVRYLNIGDRYMDTTCVLPEGCKYKKANGCTAEYHVLCDMKAMEEDGVEIPEHMKNIWRIVRKVPKALDINDCGVLLPLLECYSAAKNFGVRPDMDVLFYGAGPMGLATMKFVKLFGVKSLTCIDMVDERLEMARRISGVDLAINSAKENVDEILKDKKFDLVVDAVGLSKIVLEGSQRLKPYGTVGSMGVLAKTDNVINVQKLKNNSKLHMLNFPYSELDKLSDVVGLILTEKINPKDFYSHVVDFKKIDEILDLVKSKKAIKVVMKYDD